MVNSPFPLKDSLSNLASEFARSMLSELRSKPATLNPLSNIRILDQYAIWIILSQLGVDNGLFGEQDVTHGYLEPKHQKHFNPIVLHYTT